MQNDPSVSPAKDEAGTESHSVARPSLDDAAQALVGDASHASHPPLLSDRAFWGMTGTLFFGAFNDNLFKQLLLLLAVPAAVQGVAAGDNDQQWLALFVFALPFLMFSGIAGFISERQSKRNVLVICKAAEIVVMLLGLVVLILYARLDVEPESLVGLIGLFAVLYLMGAQSAFFGPGKFGVLPELFRERDLPRANGVVMMATFLAIIFGTALAGPLNDLFNKRMGKLWLAACACVIVAIIGTLTSLLIRRTEPASPKLPFRWSALAIPGDVCQLLWRDRPLLMAMLVSCMFWLVGGIVQPSVNKLGKAQLLEGHPWADTWTSVLAAGVGVGIALGCILAGLLSQGRANFRIVRIGCYGIVACLILLSVPGGGHNLLGYWGSMAALISLGVFTGFFIVPLQVFLQSRPPKGQVGRVIATMNLTNWIAILLSALLYLGFVSVLRLCNWPPSAMFGFTAALMLPVALFYRPKDELLNQESVPC